MTQEQIIEGNKLIAEFMDLKVITDDSDLDSPEYNLPNQEYWDIEELAYNSDWNTLMPVVEKIESLGYVVEINKARIHIWTLIGINQPVFHIVEKTKLQTLCDAVYEFIKWYNTQEK